MKISREFYYRIRPIDNIHDLEIRFNTDKNNITRNNPNIPLYTGEWVKIKVNDYITHYVKPMETLMDIAKHYNVDIQSIRENNNLSIDKLYIGQMLKIYKKIHN